MTPLLQVADLRTWFPIRRGVIARTIGHVRAVDGVSLEIAPGETLGLVGESGCGKSTLARTILRLDPPTSGRIVFGGRDLLAASAAELLAARRELQVVFQDPFASLNPRMTVLDLVTEGLVEHRLIRARDRRDAAIRLLKDVGLPESVLHRYPHEFSGGQRQRIGVARAISLRPKLVICDEAVSALDVSVQAQVLNLFVDLREEHQLAYLFISHDLGVVRYVSHRVAVMYLGRIVEVGDAAGVMDHPAHPYTRALVSAIPRPGIEGPPRMTLGGDVPSAARPPSGCRFHPRCPFATAECRRDEPELAALAHDPARRVACLRKNEV
jgi:oligopeptide transport system ATP-binding protein